MSDWTSCPCCDGDGGMTSGSYPDHEVRGGQYRATPAPLDVTSDDFRDRHERAMRDHILACDPEHCCDDLCSDEIITRLAGQEERP